MRVAEVGERGDSSSSLRACRYSKYSGALEVVRSHKRTTTMSSIIQIALAFVGVLVVPGFAASLAIFPRFSQIEVTERMAISIGLSITLVISIGMLLGYSAFLADMTGGITAYSLIAALSVITLIFLVIWILRAASFAIKRRRAVVRPKRGA